MRLRVGESVEVVFVRGMEETTGILGNKTRERHFKGGTLDVGSIFK